MHLTDDQTKMVLDYLTSLASHWQSVGARINKHDAEGKRETAAKRKAARALIFELENIKSGGSSAACYWNQEDEDSDCWGTTCGEYYYISEGTPDENSMKFCTFCGCHLKQQVYTMDEP